MTKRTKITYIIISLILLMLGIGIVFFFWYVNFPPYIYQIRNNVNEEGKPCTPDRSHDNDPGGYYRGCGIPVSYPVVVGGTLKVTSDFCSLVSGVAQLELIYILSDTGEQAAKYNMKIPFVKGFCTENPRPSGDFPIPDDLDPDKEYYVRFISRIPRRIGNPIKQETQTLKFKPVMNEN